MFVHDDYVSGFDIFLKICEHIACGHVPPLISCLFVASWLLALEKQTKGVWPIVIRKVIYRLIAYTLTIQFKDTFVEHFNPHQFGVATLSKCETMVDGIKAMLNLHLEWVVL